MVMIDIPSILNSLQARIRTDSFYSYLVRYAMSSMISHNDSVFQFNNFKLPKMGNWQSQNSFESWIGDDTLDYYTSVQQPNLGLVQIYTCSRKLPMTYLLKLQKPLASDQLLDQKFESIQNCHNPSLIKLYNCHRQKPCLCTATPTLLISYWQYYNYTLNHLIQRRQDRGIGFTQDQLWHIVKVCCQGYLAVNRQGFLVEFETTKLVITPEGKVKMVWAYLEASNGHLRFLRYFVNGSQQEEEGYYSPEELEGIRNRQRLLRMDFNKANVYSFGMVLLYCITLTDPLDYVYRGTAIDFSQLDHIIKSFKQKAYSKHLWSLVDQCLQTDPKKRIDFNQIDDQYSKFFNEDFGMSLASTQVERTDIEKSLSKSDNKKTRISLRRNKLDHSYSHF